jgi:hypothetical protein
MKTQFDQYYPTALRVVGEMTGADEIMHQAIFLGSYPGPHRGDARLKNPVTS